MFCKARTRALVIGLLAIAGILCAPSAGFAAPDSATLLAPGAGYATPKGSQPVRDVQRLLRRLGDAPGPVDGLYGPLTAGAVQRFQEAHALAVDGVVGPQTMGRLVAERSKLRKAKLERKSPARSNRAESVIERPPAHTRPNAQPDRAKPDSSTGPSPWLAAAGGTRARPAAGVRVEARQSPPGPPAGPAHAWSEARSRVRSAARGVRRRRRYGRGVRQPCHTRSRRQAEHRDGRTEAPLITLGETPARPVADRLCAAAGGPGARAPARRGIRPGALLQRHPGALRERRVRARGRLQPPGWQR